MKNLTRQSGFTLIELLVVVAIIAIISGMAIMLASSVTDKAAATTSMATQKQLTGQIGSYMQLHNDLLPDNFDSMIRSDYAAVGGTYETISSKICVASDPSSFMGCSASSSSAGALNINRGVDPDSFSGENRTLTVKQITSTPSAAVDSSDLRCLNQLGLTTLYDYSTNNLSYGRLSSTSRVIAADGPICIIDPQSVAGQQLYRDFGTDLSNATNYPRNVSSTGTHSWDDSNELTAAGRLAALQQQIFYVVGLGVNSTMIGDRLAGLQEAPASSVVSGGYYNRYGIVIRAAGTDSGRSASFVGVLDPKGRGASAARQTINAIK